jgi:hypothetical protein
MFLSTNVANSKEIGRRKSFTIFHVHSSESFMSFRFEVKDGEYILLEKETKITVQVLLITGFMNPTKITVQLLLITGFMNREMHF